MRGWSLKLFGAAGWLAGLAVLAILVAAFLVVMDRHEWLPNIVLAFGGGWIARTVWDKTKEKDNA